MGSTQLSVHVVLLEGRRVEVDTPVRFVGVAVVDDTLNHLDDFVHVLGGSQKWKKCTSETRVITFAVRQPSVFMSSINSFSYFRASSVNGIPASVDLSCELTPIPYTS